MQLQPEFFHHVTGIHAGDAAPLMARIALGLLSYPTAHPMPLDCVKDIGRFARDPGHFAVRSPERIVADAFAAALAEDV